MTTATLTYKAIQQRVTLLHAFKINWKMVYFLGILFCFSMVVFYVLLVNQLTGGTYVIKGYNKQISTLIDENKALEDSFAESGFLGDVQEKTKGLNFEKITQVKYVQILDNALAKVPINYQK